MTNYCDFSVLVSRICPEDYSDELCGYPSFNFECKKPEDAPQEWKV
jgi:hypothetical protein